MSSLTFDNIVLTPFLNGLKNSLAFIKKGRDHATSSSLDPNDLLNARLHPDMKDFIYQVQRYTDSAKAAPARINPAIEGLSLPDEEKTFEELIARVEKVIAYLEGIDRKLLVGREAEEVTMQFGGRVELHFSALEYVQGFAHPNFWFHVTTTYALLRSKGVDIGKRDFLNGAGLIPMKPIVKPEGGQN